MLQARVFCNGPFSSHAIHKPRKRGEVKPPIMTPSNSDAVSVTSLPRLPPAPKPSILNQPLPALSHPAALSRRCAAVLSLLALVSRPAPAAAFSLGISGPKDWLKEQKRKSSRFLLAPIDASRESLRSVYTFLKDPKSDYTEIKVEEVQALLRSAARDCVSQDRSSFVAFQATSGVEVCTFRLIVKNAASLLDKTDPVKLEAESMLEDLIRSFSSLNGLADGADVQFTSKREKIANALVDTIASLDKFEQSIKDCLEV